MRSSGRRQASHEFYSRLNYVVVEKVLRSMGATDQDVQVAVNKYKAHFPEWRLDSFPGFLGNVMGALAGSDYCLLLASAADESLSMSVLHTLYITLHTLRRPCRSAAGRCANVFNLDGMNCVVDAACASSLIAVKVGVATFHREIGARAYACRMCLGHRTVPFPSPPRAAPHHTLRRRPSLDALPEPSTINCPRV